MIFFCEDCGKKNILSPTQLENGKAVFRCKACNYWNSYFVKTEEEADLKRADDFLKRLLPFPEIIGSFLFHTTTGVLSNNMPDMLNDSDLDVLGKLLTETVSVGRSQYPDVKEMALILSSKNILIKMINKNLAVIIVSKLFPLSKPLRDQLAQLGSTGTAQNGQSK
jgi:DNA-directed RNA polymerase subunit RPC12/RpoP